MKPQHDNSDEPLPMVLVIDDSADVHRLLKARLRHEELQLATATDGHEGVRAVRELKPAVVLLDLDMPGMDGFEVLRVLMDDPATVHIPVIVLSGLSSAQDKVTAFDLGASDYITKPFNLTELRVRVRSALRMHRLVQMLAQRAHIDGLTGLWNRTHFDRRLEDEVAGCVRHGRPLSVAFIDIDHFKAVNDAYGHPSGDAVLQGLARILQRESRQGDAACRYGGEEFVLILPDTAPADAAAHCERIRTNLEKTVWPRHPERPVTASFGIAGSVRPGPVPAEEWIEAADRSLYEAKSGGRNRVAVCDLGIAERAPLARAG